MRPSDDELLYDILEFARELEQWVADRTLDDLFNDRGLQLIITKLVENIGEAATRVSQQRRSELPQIPWRDMATTRHRLVHGYRRIDLEILWETASVSVLELLEAVEPVIAAMEHARGSDPEPSHDA